MTSPFTPSRFFPSLFPLVGLLLLFGCKSEQHAQHQPLEPLPPLAVEVAIVQGSSPIRQVEIMATVRAAESATISARVSGNIIELPVKLGSIVSKDETLAVISAGEITAKLNQAQAQLDQAERNLNRERNLLKKNAATQESVKTLEESKKIAQAAYKEARTMLSYTTITAPFDGVITLKSANIGDLATPGKTLLKLENESSLQIIADVPEALIPNLALSDKLPVTIEAANQDIEGEITEIAPTADPRSRTAQVKLTIAQNPKIRSGQFARVSLPSSGGNAFMIPVSAIRPFGQLDRVFIVKENAARLQLIKTGLRYGNQVEALTGLSAGDQIVVSDSKEISDGRQITFQ
jgi:RND family efflux transporter MFP subunit